MPREELQQYGLVPDLDSPAQLDRLVGSRDHDQPRPKDNRATRGVVHRIPGDFQESTLPRRRRRGGGMTHPDAADSSRGPARPAAVSEMLAAEGAGDQGNGWIGSISTDTTPK